MNRTPSTPRLVEPNQARYVAGVLQMLVAMVGRGSCLGIILQQARCEVTSLARSERDAVAARRVA